GHPVDVCHTPTPRDAHVSSFICNDSATPLVYTLSLHDALPICLVICTLLYVAITLVLTGMVNYTELNVKDPLTFVFKYVGFDHMAGVISVTSVVAITSALVVYQLAQPRI